ncbi:MAG: hypothetical protein H0W33_08970 [Gammaproteobacteria bacterium]|nr:hypothetical protein [Gammaproteobacteria bacterium]
MRCLLLLGLLAVTGCATPPAADTDPFILPPDALFSRVRTIALMPMGVAVSLEHSASVARHYEALVTSRLEAAGFAVIPSSAYMSIHKEVAAYMSSGDLDDEGKRVVRDYALRELLARHGGDALLYPLISLVGVDPSGRSAVWHGIEESTAGEPGSKAGVAANGRTLPALSFIVLLTGTGGESYYADAGGVQLLAHLREDRLVDVPRDELLTDDARNERAVALALGRLVR